MQNPVEIFSILLFCFYNSNSCSRMIPIQPNIVKKASEVDQEVPIKVTEMEEKVEVLTPPLQTELETENPRLYNVIEPVRTRKYSNQSRSHAGSPSHGMESRSVSDPGLTMFLLY